MELAKCVSRLGAIFFFFFSSRRRHTRLQGDWSSDVCSSDLRLCLLPRHSRNHPPEPRASAAPAGHARAGRSEEHTSELQSPCNLVCRLLLEKKKKKLYHTLIDTMHTIPYLSASHLPPTHHYT